MTGPVPLATNDGLRTVEVLFRSMGYEVEPVRIEPAEWAEAGISLALSEGAALFHLSRVGTLDLFVLEGAEPAHEVAENLVRTWQRHNAALKAVVFSVDSSSRISVHDQDERGRMRRLDLASPLSVPTIDRLKLLELIGDQTKTIDARALFDRVLSREALTRRFFVRFRDAVAAVRSALAAQFPAESEESVSGQSLLILSRVLFLYFVQQKGWLAGERRFLVDRFDSAAAEGRSFYSTVLTPLFFGCLNTPVALRDSFARSLGEIPYLNGGLFQRARFESRHPDATIANDLMRFIFDEVFERFAFCVEEGDPEEARIDPEMLGRVFESLMQSDERLRTGSFYTPPEIVDVLTRRAIVEFCAGGEERVAGQLRRCLSDSSEFVPDAGIAATALDRLRNMTVLDPACGSGAFLLSALRIIERLTRRLSLGCEAPVDGALRQTIVERSLFGVDLKPEAVQLCELRLWLAIVSDSGARIDAVSPLPNLDRNIMQGNSLLGPLDSFTTARGEIYHAWAHALRARRRMIEEYRHAPPGEKPSLARFLREADLRLAGALAAQAIVADRRELEILGSHGRLFESVDTSPRHDPAEGWLRRRIERNEAILRRTEEGELDFFSYDVHFAHVMAEGGFSVVVGNPPWVRRQRIDPEDRRLYAERYPLFGGAGGPFPQADLSVAFIERSLALTEACGVVSMLIPSKVLTARYGAALRRSLARETRIVAVDDWSAGSRAHFRADAFPTGLTLSHSRRGAKAVTVSNEVGSTEKPQSELTGIEPGEPWSLLPPEQEEVVRRLRAEFPRLKDVLGRVPVMGVKTGANRRFFLEDMSLSRHGAVVPDLGVTIPFDSICRCVRGRDLHRWSAVDSTWMLWPPIGGWVGPPAWVEQVARKLSVPPARLRLAYVRPEHLGVKVAWKDVSRGLQAAVLPATVRIEGLDFPLVPNQTLYCLDAASLDEAWVLSALLNSSVVNALAVAKADRAKDAHFRYFGTTIAELPLPRLVAGDAEWRALSRLARRAHGGAEVIRDIDEIVAGIYRLSARECTTLQTMLNGKLQRP